MEWPFNVFQSLPMGARVYAVKLTLSNQRAFGFASSFEI